MEDLILVISSCKEKPGNKANERQTLLSKATEECINCTHWEWLWWGNYSRQLQ